MVDQETKIAKSSDKPGLIYFDFNERAEQIRILLSHAKVDYIYERVKEEDWPLMDPQIVKN